MPSLSEIERHIKKCTFPALPQVLVQMRRITDDETTTARDLADIILKDQALTAKILSAANSAYYGFYGNVSTVTQAIVALGFDSVKNIALSLAAYGTISAWVRDPCVKQFWEHSLATGVCAELLAEKIGYTPTEEALVAGLVHDVGKLLLVQLYPDQYAEVARVLNEQPDAYSHTVETSILGVTHAEVGRLLVRAWGFPAVLADVVADHHKKHWGRHQLTDIVGFSDFMIAVLPRTRGTDQLERMILLGSSVLNLKKESIAGVTQALADRLEAYSRIFDIRIENLMAYTTMMEQECDRIKKSADRQLRQRDDQMAILTEISQAMVAGQSQKAVLQMIVEGVMRSEEAAAAILFTRAGDHAALRGSLGLGKNAMYVAATYTVALPEAESSLADAVRSGAFRFARDGADLPLADRELLAELDVSCFCAIPLPGPDHAPGVILVAWDSARDEPDQASRQRLMLFANQAVLALRRDTAAKQDRTGTERKRSTLMLDVD